MLLGSNAFNEENHYELKIIAGFYDNTEKHDMSRLEKLPQSLKVLWVAIAIVGFNEN